MVNDWDHRSGHGGACAACGEPWPCDSYLDWAENESAQLAYEDDEEDQ